MWEERIEEVWREIAGLRRKLERYRDVTMAELSSVRDYIEMVEDISDQRQRVNDERLRGDPPVASDVGVAWRRGEELKLLAALQERLNVLRVQFESEKGNVRQEIAELRVEGRRDRGVLFSRVEAVEQRAQA